MVAAPVVPAPIAPEQAAPLPSPKPKRRDIEELITARWGVWLGAAALMLAGVFLVRYASDQGLLGPGTRCLAMLVLAAALLGLAEWLHRGRLRVSTLPDYAPQALAAGAVGILLGAAYLAGVIYALVPAPIGFALMAAAAVAGLVLSLHFGQLVAAVGIVGGFLTPALVQTDAPSLPGLFVYLLCLTAAALAVVRVRAWIWLGWATTIAGAGWVLLVTLGMGARDDWAAALFVPAAAVMNLALLPSAALDHPVGRRLGWVPVAALGFSGLLLAFADPGLVTRAGVLPLAPITVARGRARVAAGSAALPGGGAVPAADPVLGAARLAGDRRDDQRGGRGGGGAAWCLGARGAAAAAAGLGRDGRVLRRRRAAVRAALRASAALGHAGRLRAGDGARHPVCAGKTVPAGPPVGDGRTRPRLRLDPCRHSCGAGRETGRAPGCTPQAPRRRWRWERRCCWPTSGSLWPSCCICRLWR